VVFLVDTSIWIDHLSGRETRLQTLLDQNRALTHPWVIGEISLGNLGPNRSKILRLLASLKSTTVASFEECLALIENHNLGGAGIGWVDCQLLASTLLQPGVHVLTKDKRLAAISTRPYFYGRVVIW
jgi:predicted nucleic acid-binding protein